MSKSKAKKKGKGKAKVVDQNYLRYGAYVTTLIQSLTFQDMADIIELMRKETKRRNPLGVNAYIPSIRAAFEAFEEIAEGERNNRTCEEGPMEWLK
jgi:hypothetical protein